MVSGPPVEAGLRRTLQVEAAGGRPAQRIAGVDDHGCGHSRPALQAGRPAAQWRRALASQGQATAAGGAPPPRPRRPAGATSRSLVVPRYAPGARGLEPAGASLCRAPARRPPRGGEQRGTLCLGGPAWQASRPWKRIARPASRRLLAAVAADGPRASTVDATWRLRKRVTARRALASSAAALACGADAAHGTVRRWRFRRRCAASSTAAGWWWYARDGVAVECGHRCLVAPDWSVKPSPCGMRERAGPRLRGGRRYLARGRRRQAASTSAPGRRRRSPAPCDSAPAGYRLLTPPAAALIHANPKGAAIPK